VIANYQPGGGLDGVTRPFMDRLSRLLGQQFVVDNKGGASGAIGIEAATKAAPDGYTFLATPSLSVVILPHLRKVPYDPLKDLVPVTQFADGTLLFAVHASIPANSIQEFVAYAKQNPGKLNWGTPGVGTYGHLMCETFKAEAGLDIVHVPYRGTGEALPDFLAGVFHVYSDPVTLPHVVSGRAKLLAVLDRERRPDFPHVPVLKEIYPALDFLLWFGIFAPPGTPQSIVQSMSRAMNKVAGEQELRQHLFNIAMTPHPGTPDELAALLRSDYERYGKLTRQFNISSQ
jgi:putative tricarboxylic transport membrane protein